MESTHSSHEKLAPSKDGSSPMNIGLNTEASTANDGNTVALVSRVHNPSCSSADLPVELARIPDAKAPYHPPPAGTHKLSDHIGLGKQKHTKSQLCAKCQHVFDLWLDIVEAMDGGEEFVEYSHWDNVLLFESAASDGCHLCILFLNELKESELKGAHDYLKVMTVTSSISWCARSLTVVRMRRGAGH